jgi:hypothetical protein
VYEIGSKKMVKMGLWAEKNLFLIHIRDFRQMGYGNFHIPEQKGIALTHQVWRVLFQNI